MALTQLKTGAIADDAVTTDKLANAINTERTANTAKDLTALSASNLTSGTVPDARFPATLPAASAANLTAVPAANITGTLPAISGANLTSLTATNLTGTIADARFPATLPAISGANLTNLPASGKILQIKSGNFTSQFAHAASSGTGFVATNITLDFTPTSASSAVYVRGDFNIWKSGDSAQINMTLYRDSTNLGNSFYGFGEYAINASYALQWNLAYVDSPNTTSQVTYKVYARVQSGHHFNMGVNNVPTNLTILEYTP